MSQSAKPLYEPLDPSRREIRLLHIRLDAADGCNPGPHFTLVTKSLDDPYLEYFALSYVWGETFSSRPFVISGHNVKVTENLMEFLQRYPDLFQISLKKRADKHLWVDALCIHQEDDDEKSNQVQLMTSIYRSASLVLSWLGVEANDSDYALLATRDLCSSISSNTDEAYLHQWLKSADSRQMELWQSSPTGVKDHLNRFWRSMKALLERPYWQRAWVVQEVVLPDDVLVVCGMTAVPFNLFKQVYTLLVTVQELQPPPFVDMELWSLLTTPSGRRFLGWEKIELLFETNGLIAEAAASKTLEKISLWKYLLMQSSGMQATDPRDKLYSVLGLVDGGIRPNYGMSVEDIYSNFARECIQIEDSLQLLCIAGRGLFHGSRAMAPVYHLFLPSWVPNWDDSAKRGSTITLCMCQTVAKAREMYRQVIANADDHPLAYQQRPVSIFDGNRLTVRGVVSDSVLSRHTFRKDLSDFRAFWNEYFKLHRDQPYITGISLVQAVGRLIFTDRDVITGQPLGLCPSPAALLRTIYYASRMIEIPAEGGMSESPKLFGIVNLDDDLSYILGQSISPREQRELVREIQNPRLSMSTGEFNTANFQNDLVLSSELFLTTGGYLGWGPVGLQSGDLICVLFGCVMPVVLRKVGSSYIHMGPCFVVGLMDGEALHGVEEDPGRIQDFVLV